ncbi:RHS repeat protein, partial [Escherichia coli]|nr:RHS repeat protein [Escherichia coli]EEZ5033036.1 RHS repeat protein [Escherichia coli]EEZ9705288.1 RHS repeat protein [Escherichia coli]EFE9415838.1 RHS repeat protein [Escherichia coli]EFI7134751.1 RHS repeat protein [Escherichia coli]
FPGEDGYSRSESLWLVRGGVAKLDEGHRLAALWQALPEELRLSPHRYLATNSPQGPWWLLGWCERVPEADEVLPAPLPPYRVLTGLVDRFGRTQTFHREAAGEFSGEITGVTDGAGRHFRLVLTTQAQRAEEARQQAISGGTEPSAFPDTLPGYTEYGRDNGIRLSAVWLTHDPEYPENLPAAPLVRYGWTPRGELAAVYDRSNTQVRSFTYDDKYRGRMVAHRHTGRPEIRYRYDSDGRVTEQLNPAGLSYTYQYEKDRITITDSLDRREVLHTQGEAGLKRVVKKEHADGSVTQSQFDAVGRLKAQTDTAGRTTEYSPDVVTGLITRITTPDGRASAFYYNHHSQLTSATGPDGLEIRREYDEWGNLLNDENPHHLQQLIRLPGQQYDEESGLYYNRHRYYDPLQGRYITQDPIGLKGGWNFYQYPLNPVQYIDSMGLASKYGHLNNGGYGAKPSKPPTPDPSKLPDIAKQLRLPYPIDQASSAPNVFKTFFRALSPYDYTLYCRKWVKPNLTCTPQDDPQYPGMETKTASDYLPQTNWSTTQLPPGYTCAEPYLFPDINKPDGPATAGIDDLGEILAKMKQRTSRGIRK